MTRSRFLLAAGAVLLSAGSSNAFFGWCYCPPRCYYRAPVMYYPAPLPSTVWGCSPAMPPGVSVDRVPPKAMPESPPPKETGKEGKLPSSVLPAEFKASPKAPAELATPRPAPPPESKNDDRIGGVEPAIPSPAPPLAIEKKGVPTVPSSDLTIPKIEVPPAARTDAPKVDKTPAPMGDLTIPKIEVQPPKSDVPKVESTVSPSVEPGKLPAPAGDLTIPKIEVVPSKPDVPRVEAIGSSSVEPGKIPPLQVPAKKDDTPKVPNAGAPTGGLQIPSIDIPPPTAPTPAAPPAEKKSTSGSSPLTNEATLPAVSVRNVAGTANTTGRVSVRFFNHTAADFRLTVADGSINLPAKHYVDVQVGRSFVWKYGTQSDRRTEVPDDAGGLEIAVRR